MKVRIHLRKGGKNRKFTAIVDSVATALSFLEGEERIQGRLLDKLRQNRANLGGAWQDGDELHNILGKNSAHRFDIYNWEHKTAIEVEESEVKYVWKDFVKLAIGARKGKVENAILIVPIEYGGRNLKKSVKIFDQAIKISEFMADFLWMKNLAIIGYER